MAIDAKSGSQRWSEQSAPLVCNSISVKGLSSSWMERALGRIYHNINTMILHCRIQVFFHNGAQAVNFIDKKDIVRLQTGEQSCQITRLIEYRTRCYLKSYVQFIGNDVGESRLPNQEGQMQQYMVKISVRIRAAATKYFFQRFSTLLKSWNDSGREAHFKLRSSVLICFVCRMDCFHDPNPKGYWCDYLFCLFILIFF